MKNIKDLYHFSNILYLNRYYGESLLILHGISFGIKIGKQLNLKWSDFINERGHIKEFITIDDKIIPLNNKCKTMTIVIYKLLNDKVNLNDYIYTTKQGKRLSTDNLSKNLKRLYKILLNDNCEELTATSLEKVWALSIIEYHNYTKSIFIYLKDYLGKKTMNDLIQFVGVSPQEKILLKFDLIDEF